MTFVIAAAGTGGHVFPGLSVGEALVDLGATRDDVLYVGGDRLEKKVYPSEGFPFLEVELRGLQRSLTLKNLGLPSIVRKASKRIEGAITNRRVQVVLGMGGYVTVPAALAARRSGTPLMNSEQNAEAGLASRIVARWAARTFGSFPDTVGLPSAEWVGNPVREPFWNYDRSALFDEAIRRYRLARGVPVLGVFGGSLGAGAINAAVVDLVTHWSGRPLQVVHLTGERNHESLSELKTAEAVNWVRIPFEEAMETFYAACDVVVARAGGAVAELTATATPAILIPGSFGSAGHQAGNARYLTEAGAAVTIEESDLADLSSAVESIVFDESALTRMREESRRIAKPDAARTIAEAMLETIQ